VGDLSQPLLGLSTGQFDLLASQIDVIYHKGASVNLVYPYSALKPANVLGTQEVVRPASRVKVTPVHVISTYSTLPVYAQVKAALEDHDLERGEVHYAGYVLERIEGEDRARAMPGVVEVELLQGPGASLSGLHDSWSRAACAIATGQSPDEAVARAQDATKQLRFLVSCRS
jgi:hypothetical protein